MGAFEVKRLGGSSKRQIMQLQAADAESFRKKIYGIKKFSSTSLWWRTHVFKSKISCNFRQKEVGCDFWMSADRSFPRRNFGSLCSGRVVVHPKSSTFNWISFCRERSSESVGTYLYFLKGWKEKGAGDFTGQAASNLGQPTKRKTQVVSVFLRGIPTSKGLVMSGFFFEEDHMGR